MTVGDWPVSGRGGPSVGPSYHGRGEQGLLDVALTPISGEIHDPLAQHEATKCGAKIFVAGQPANGSSALLDDQVFDDRAEGGLELDVAGDFGDAGEALLAVDAHNAARTDAAVAGHAVGQAAIVTLVDAP